MIYNYDSDSLRQVFIDLGLKHGDKILIHSDIANLGIPRESVEFRKNPCALILDTLMSVIGIDGTVIVPTFTYSFCRKVDYDVSNSRSLVGVLGEFVRNMPDATRNYDPIFSMAAIGKDKNIIHNYEGNNSFDVNSSPFLSLYKNDVRVLFLGVESNYLTLLHLADEFENVPWRYHKIFSGNIINNGLSESVEWIYPVRVNIKETISDGSNIHNLIFNNGLLKKHPSFPVYFGNGRVICDYARSILKRNPWCLKRSKVLDLEEADKRRTGFTVYNFADYNADIRSLLKNYYNVPRFLISDGYDSCINHMASVFPLNISRYKSGYEAFGEIVPERWVNLEFKIINSNYDNLVEISDSKLLAYSRSYKGIVTRDELIKHFYTYDEEDNHENADVMSSRNYITRDWGLCGTISSLKKLINENFSFVKDFKDDKDVKDGKDGKYFVKICSDFSYGSLKIGEYYIKGRSDAEIIVCANLSSKYFQFTDISSSLCGLLLFDRLRNIKSLNYSYRLLIVPDIPGLACYLSSYEKQFKCVALGVFISDIIGSSEFKLGVKNLNNHVTIHMLDNFSRQNCCYNAVYDDSDRLSPLAEFFTKITNCNICCINRNKKDNHDYYHDLNLGRQLDDNLDTDMKEIEKKINECAEFIMSLLLTLDTCEKSL